MVAQGGMHGCSGGACMVAQGGHVWLLRGGVWLLMGGHVWLLTGGVCFFFLDEVWSMSGRYASYWNAFLYGKYFWIFIYHILNMIVYLYQLLLILKSEIFNDFK